MFSPRTTATEARAWGDKYLEAGRFHDAVAFYTKAGYQQGLARVIEMAVEAGDFQLLEEAAGGMGEELHQEIQRLARRAEQLGRWCDAQRAYAYLGDDLGRRRAREAIEGLLGKRGEADPGGQAQGEGL